MRRFTRSKSESSPNFILSSPDTRMPRSHQGLRMFQQLGSACLPPGHLPEVWQDLGQSKTCPYPGEKSQPYCFPTMRLRRRVQEARHCARRLRLPLRHWGRSLLSALREQPPALCKGTRPDNQTYFRPFQADNVHSLKSDTRLIMLPQWASDSSLFLMPLMALEAPCSKLRKQRLQKGKLNCSLLITFNTACCLELCRAHSCRTCAHGHKCVYVHTCAHRHMCTRVHTVMQRHAQTPPHA